MNLFFPAHQKIFSDSELCDFFENQIISVIAYFQNRNGSFRMICPGFIDPDPVAAGQRIEHFGEERSIYFAQMGPLNDSALLMDELREEEIQAYDQWGRFSSDFIGIAIVHPEGDGLAIYEFVSAGCEVWFETKSFPILEKTQFLLPVPVTQYYHLRENRFPLADLPYKSYAGRFDFSQWVSDTPYSVLSLFTETPELFSLAFLIKRNGGLWLLFQKNAPTEERFELEKDEATESICGQFSIFFDALESFSGEVLETFAALLAFEPGLGFEFSIQLRADARFECLLKTSKEEVRFVSQSEPILELSEFYPWLSPATYSEIVQFKYG